jgi:exosome complex RNA-binding protein Rrp4
MARSFWLFRFLYAIFAQKRQVIYFLRVGHTREAAVCFCLAEKRYTPCLEDMVIGVVTDKHADDYRVDIRGSRWIAMLPLP